MGMARSVTVTSAGNDPFMRVPPGDAGNPRSAWRSRPPGRGRDDSFAGAAERRRKVTRQSKGGPGGLRPLKTAIFCC
jgi:hypothetical protein